jgi:hypothetical protein
MQTLIIKDGKVTTTHTAAQYAEVKDLYPGCEVVQWNGGHVAPDSDDPRTEQQQALDAANAQYVALLAQHAAEEAAGVTLTNGWRMGYSQVQRSNYAEIKAAIDMLGSTRTWRLWDADGVEHADLTAEQAMAVITEYTLLVAAQRERQFGELAALWG